MRYSFFAYPYVFSCVRHKRGLHCYCLTEILHVSKYRPGFLCQRLHICYCIHPTCLPCPGEKLVSVRQQIQMSQFFSPPWSGGDRGGCSTSYCLLDTLRFAKPGLEDKIIKSRIGWSLIRLLRVCPAREEHGAFSARLPCVSTAKGGGHRHTINTQYRDAPPSGVEHQW